MMKSVFLRGVSILLIGSSYPAHAILISEIPAEHLAKTTPVVFEKAVAGVPQELIVEYDGSEILLAEQGRRRTHDSDPQSNNLSEEAKWLVTQQLIEDTDAQFVAAATEIGADLRNSGVVLSKVYGGFPVLVATVPNIDALAHLLAHAKIKKVYDDREVLPAGSNNLSLIEQPVAIVENKLGERIRVAMPGDCVRISMPAFSSSRKSPACRGPY